MSLLRDPVLLELKKVKVNPVRFMAEVVAQVLTRLRSLAKI